MSKHNKEYFNAFRREIEAAVAEVAKRRNLKIEAGNITLEDERNFKMQLVVKEGDAQAAEAKARREWDLYCTGYGLTPDDFGKSFNFRGKNYRATGIAPGKRCPIKTDGGTMFASSLFKTLISKP